MPSEYKSRCVAKKYILRLLVGHQGGRNAQTMKYSCYKKPYVDFSLLMFSVRSWYKKKISEHTSVYIFFFFLTRQLSAPAFISEEEMEFPKMLAEQILKIIARRPETAVKIFP